MKKLVLIGVILLLIGGVTAGVANSYISDQNQKEEVNFNSSGFGNSGLANDSNKTQNNVLNVNNKITVINVTLIDIWYQYIELIIMDNNASNTENNDSDVENNTLDFNNSTEESIKVGNHMFPISNGYMMSNGYKITDNDFYSSEIYKTSDNCSFGIIVISNPTNGTTEELAKELIENGFSVTKDTLGNIDTLEDIDVYKFELEGITHYIYDWRNDIVIIVMNQENDRLFMYLTNSATTDELYEFDPYYNPSSSNTFK